jgi:NitT/TauT family transport system substrate-binding protein
MRIETVAGRCGLRLLIAVASMLLVAGGAAPPAQADVKEVRFARQLGLGYLQFYVMQDHKLVEKHARALGLGEITTSYRPLGTPTALTDTLLSGNVDVVGIGLPAFLTLWDRTQETVRVRGIVALNRQPAYLLTRKPGITSLKDYTENDRIALPAPKVSVQAIMLQMIAEKQFGAGRHTAVDHLTVAMSHPDGTIAMLGGRSEVTSHFTSAPFQYQQLQSKEIRKVLSSYDATDGPNTFSVAAMTSPWREANPTAYKAVLAAIREANAFIASNPRQAAEIFVRIENIKMPLEFIEQMIKDPEFSYEPAPMNVLKIQNFMHRVGTLKRKPEKWVDLFFPEVHDLSGS